MIESAVRFLAFPVTNLEALHRQAKILLVLGWYVLCMTAMGMSNHARNLRAVGVAQREFAVPRRDIVVIGASAGGVQALLEVVRGFPSDLPAAIFVVVHVPSGKSALPEILARASGLPATHARNGEQFELGHIYVAPPDYHMLVRSGWIDLSHGPRENRTRPAIDPLFRSAARAFGPRVAGVILSGALGDGATGLLAVKSRGGYSIVQDPSEAIIESMPRSALRLVEIDSVLPAASIAAEIVRQAGKPVREEGLTPMNDDMELAEIVISEDFEEQVTNRRASEITPLTCPDCGETLWQAMVGPVLRFQCHVGHSWEGERLLDLKSEQVEDAHWASVRILKERAALNRQVASRARSGGDTERAARIDEQAALDDDRAESIRDLLDMTLAQIGADFRDSKS
jgi:two-component system chemotaxis response regulator CheB